MLQCVLVWGTGCRPDPFFPICGQCAGLLVACDARAPPSAVSFARTHAVPVSLNTEQPGQRFRLVMYLFLQCRVPLEMRRTYNPDSVLWTCGCAYVLTGDMVIL